MHPAPILGDPKAQGEDSAGSRPPSWPVLEKQFARKGRQRLARRKPIRLRPLHVPVQRNTAKTLEDVSRISVRRALNTTPRQQHTLGKFCGVLLLLTKIVLVAARIRGWRRIIRPHQKRPS